MTGTKQGKPKSRGGEDLFIESYQLSPQGRQTKATSKFTRHREQLSSAAISPHSILFNFRPVLGRVLDTAQPAEVVKFLFTPDVFQVLTAPEI